MNSKKYSFLIIASTFLLCSSCSNKQSLMGSWKPIEVKIWDFYHIHPLHINVTAKSFSYNQDDTELVERMTHEYKDSLLVLIDKTYLILKPDSTFLLEDYGFFTQVLSDSAWQGQHSGTWSMDLKRSILTLSQSKQLRKEYKIMSHSDNTIKIGELYQREPVPITEILLAR